MPWACRVPSFLIPTVVALLVIPANVRAECPPLVAPTTSSEANVFSPEEERALGEVMADQVEQQFRSLEADQLVDFPERIAKRLLAQFPEGPAEVEIALIDLPEPNAFSIPGGRIFLSRKVIAAARNEDELAGVIAHELGHDVAHQVARNFTLLLDEVLDVKSVGGKENVPALFHRLLEREATDRRAVRVLTERYGKNQIEADRLAIQALARAGWQPKALVGLYDRIARTKGKTGSWVGDIFGVTQESERRLRSLREAEEGLSAGCRSVPLVGATEEFQRWKTAVGSWSSTKRQEKLDGIVSRARLSPPLASEFDHLVFSPDGRFVLAQDQSVILVLGRDPFKLLFRIDAPGAYPATFSADGKSVVSFNDDLRIESWDVEHGERSWVRDLVSYDGCLQPSLSNDGRLLACWTNGYAVEIFDVESGESIYRYDHVYTPSPYDLNFLTWALLRNWPGRWSLMNMGFSPNNRWFAIARGDETHVVDLQARKEAKVPRRVRNLLRKGFVWLDDHRLVGIDGEDSGIVEVPGGEVLDTFALGIQELAVSACGKFLVLRPVKDFPVGVMELATHKFVLANKAPGVDLFGDDFVSQQKDGRVGLFRREGAKVETIAAYQSPVSPLSGSGGVVFSDDLRFAAISNSSQAGIWAIDSGRRMEALPSFGDGFFDGEGWLHADFEDVAKEKAEKGEKGEETNRRHDAPRRIGAIRVRDGEVRDGPPLEKKSSLAGPFLVATAGGEDEESRKLVVSDGSTGKLLWERRFEEGMPGIELRAPFRSLILDFDAGSSEASGLMKKTPGLKERYKRLEEKRFSRLLQVLDAQSGKTRGFILVDTGEGSFFVRSGMVSVGDTVAVLDSSDRVLVYSLGTGSLRKRLFGTQAVLSPDGRILGVRARRNEVVLYGVETLAEISRLRFTNDVVAVSFAADSSRFAVLTTEQEAIVLDTPVPGFDLASGLAK
jgi:WD40 repeat protein